MGRVQRERRREKEGERESRGDGDGVDSVVDAVGCRRATCSK